MWTRRGEVCEATAGLLTLLGSGSEPWTGGRLLATGYCYNTTTGAGARERENNRDCHNKRREHQMHNIHTTCDFGSFVVLTIPWFINRLSQLLNWRLEKHVWYGMCEIGSINVWIYASFICAKTLPPITFALKMFRLFNTNIQSINYFYIGCKSAWDCHSCNWSPDSANFSHHDLTHPQPH